MLALLLVTGAVAFTSCQREGETQAAEEQTSSAPDPTESSGNGEPVTDSTDRERGGDELPSVIYYDLTRFEWYARGEPMRLDDGNYAPRGAPVRAATSEMKKIGEYEGVEYYARENGADSEGVVYVPVFEGFWLPFVRE